MGSEMCIRDRIWGDDRDVEIWRGGSRRRIASEVQDFCVSDCGKRLAVLVDDGRILEMEEEGELNRKGERDFDGCDSISYLRNGDLLIWKFSFSSEAFVLSRDGANSQSLENFPAFVRQAAPSDIGVFLRTYDFCFLYDVDKQKRELIACSDHAMKSKTAKFRYFVCDPQGQRLFLECSDRENSQNCGVLSMHRLDPERR